MIDWIERGARRLRRALSRNEWSLRLLRLPKIEPSETPGMVLIQIDGLARVQLEHALRRGRMRFLRGLVQRGGYELHNLYSGLPSTTPAAQAELFYGRPCAVPAFAFRRRSDGSLMNMLKGDCAAAVEADLEQEGEPLLGGGSSYSNIYTGGAKEAHFCASRLSAAHLMKAIRPWGMVTVAALNLGGLLSLGLLLGVEAFLAVFDALRGGIRRGEYRYEFLFLFSRVFVCVGLREVITAMACLDVTRGLPMVQVNFNGYDEQSHRRGPSSALAHFGLRGIDRSIRRIFRAAERSGAREYEVWIYSDHGQEHAVPFLRLRRETLAEAAARCVQAEVKQEAAGVDTRPDGSGSDRVMRSQDPTGQRIEDLLLRRRPSVAESPQERRGLKVAALGPVAHVYLPTDFSGDVGAVAGKLVASGAPLVLADLRDGTARAYTERGIFLLPRDAAEVLTPHHPFLPWCGPDLVTLCRHPDAGDLVVCGWRPGGPCVTFAFENGAHGGPGFFETRAFALLPRHRFLPDPARHLDLRAAVQAARQPAAPASVPPLPFPSEPRLRVLCYNVHGLVGMDGRSSPDRIARVIAAYRPHLIALQECYEDHGHTQARRVRDRLVSSYRYPETLDVVNDGFGNAWLGIFPFAEVWQFTFPMPPGFRGEARGALGAVVPRNGGHLRLCCTHFGLTAAERDAQARALQTRLAGDDAPLILAGDFNAGPDSPPLARLGRYWHDAQRGRGHRPRNTFFGSLPMTRIDHVLLSPELRAEAVQVPRTHLTRVASDHLPLLVDISPVATPAASL